MNAHPPRSRGLFGRPALTVTIAIAAVAGIAAGGVALARGTDNSDNSAATSWQQPVTARPSSSKAAAAAPAKKPAGDTITLSATGDIMMSNAPNRMPANDGD